MNERIELTLTVDETNLILEALGNLPFARVYALIGKIQEEAGKQIEPNEQPEAGDSDTSPQ